MTTNIGSLYIDGTGAGVVNPGSWSPGWNSAAYERAVITQVERIRATDCGRIVFGAIRQNCTVVPYEPNGRPGAGLTPTEQACSPEVSDRDARRVLHSGEDSKSWLAYTPAHWVGVGAINARADVVLLHELFHAVSASLGMVRARELFDQDAPFSNSAEFYAMLVENIYCSEVGLRLRGGRGRLTVELQDQDGFYERHAHLIEDFCREHPEISRRLAGLPTTFNPLRQYYWDCYGLPPANKKSLT